MLLDGATLNGTINNSGYTNFTGAVNVVNNSALSGVYWCAATVGINGSKTFTLSASTATFNVINGSLNNSGVLAVGVGTLNNGVAGAYSLTGGGSVTLAGGSITSTGGGAFTSNNVVSGYGKVSAPFVNNGQVIANGTSLGQLLDMSLSPSVLTTNTFPNTGGFGWYAQNQGELVLPSLAVSSPGTYDWGGAASANLVNSVRTVVNSLGSGGSLTIDLLSPTRSDVPAGLTDPIGVWKFTQTGGLNITSADVTFRYDDAAATSLTLLALFHWDTTSSGWDLVPTTPGANFTLIAAGLMSFSGDEYAIAANTSAVPEPTSLAMALSAVLGVAFVFCWNRRAAA